MLKKITLLCFCLLITFSFSVQVFAAGGDCLLQVFTKEAGNELLIYQGNEVKYSGISDRSGKITIKNIEEGEYKAVFKNEKYQSFEFSLPYEGSKVLTAYPKPINNDNPLVDNTEPSVTVPDTPTRPNTPTQPTKPSVTTPSGTTPTSPRDNDRPSRPSPTYPSHTSPSRPSNDRAQTDKNEKYVITVSWEGDNVKIRPHEITVNVFVDNVLYKTLTISDKDNWEKVILVKEGTVIVTIEGVPPKYTSSVKYQENKAEIKNVYKKATPGAPIPHTGSGNSILLFMLFGTGIVGVVLTKKKDRQYA